MTLSTKFARIVFCLSTLFPLSIRADDARPPGLPEGAQILSNIHYIPNGTERQTLDLYLPAKGTNWPLIV